MTEFSSSLSPSRTLRGFNAQGSSSLRLFILILGILCLIPIGCRQESGDAGEGTGEKEASSEEGEQTGSAGESPEDEPDVEEEPQRDPPRAVGTWPSPYAGLMVEAPIAVALVSPREAAREVDEALSALETADPALAGQVRNALEAGLGDLVDLLDPDAWKERGLEVEGFVSLQLGAGSGTRLNEAAQAVNAIIDAAPDQRSKVATENLAVLAQAGMSLRIVLPLSDRQVFEEYLTAAATSLDASGAEVISGYDRVWQLADGAAVGVALKDELVVVDTALFPWTPPRRAKEEFQAGLEILTGLAGKGFQSEGIGLPGPREETFSLFVAADLDRLAWVDRLGVIDDGVQNRSELDTRAGVASVGRQMLEHGPYRAIALEIGDAGAVASTYFEHAQPTLFDQLADQPELVVGDQLALLSMAPMIAGPGGPWKQAGLLPDQELDFGEFLKVMTAGYGLVPLLVPLWLTAAPALVWRDLVPAPARWIDPETVERAQIVAGRNLSEDNLALALVIVDRNGDIEEHQHGLACLTQRRPVQARCRDGRIKIGEKASAEFAKRQVYYLLEKRGDDVLMIVSPVEALVDQLSEQEIQTRDQLGRLSLDVTGLVASSFSELLGDPLDIAAEILGRIEANVGLDTDGLHWQLAFSPTVSVAQLARIAGPAFVEYARKSKEVEAIINLESLAIAAVARFDADGKYPVSAESVCSAGGKSGGQRVPPGDTTWSQPPWSELRFAVAAEHIYRYCYQTDPDGASFAAWAEGTLGQSQVPDSRFCVTSDENAGGKAAFGEVKRLESPTADCSW